MNYLRPIVGIAIVLPFRAPIRIESSRVVVLVIIRVACGTISSHRTLNSFLGLLVASLALILGVLLGVGRTTMARNAHEFSVLRKHGWKSWSIVSIVRVMVQAFILMICVSVIVSLGLSILLGRSLVAIHSLMVILSADFGRVLFILYRALLSIPLRPGMISGSMSRNRRRRHALVIAMAIHRIVRIHRPLVR